MRLESEFAVPAHQAVLNRSAPGAELADWCDLRRYNGLSIVALVMARWRDELVVWWVTDEDSGDWALSSGHYSTDPEGAIVEFMRRRDQHWARRPKIDFDQVRRLQFANSDDLPQVVAVDGRRRLWVGIGWVDEGPEDGFEDARLAQTAGAEDPQPAWKLTR